MYTNIDIVLSLHPSFSYFIYLIDIMKDMSTRLTEKKVARERAFEMKMKAEKEAWETILAKRSEEEVEIIIPPPPARKASKGGGGHVPYAVLGLKYNFTGRIVR